MVYGYARISTKNQNIERQVRNIKFVYPAAVIVQEAYTGTTLERPEWQRLRKHLRAGDMIVFDSVSRMSRNADDGFSLYQDLFQNGIDLVFLKEPHINTETYKKSLESNIPVTGTSVDILLDGVKKYLMVIAKEQIRLAFEQSEKEVMDLRQRTKEGIETARLNGKQIGGVKGKKLHVKKKIMAKILMAPFRIKMCLKLSGLHGIHITSIKKNFDNSGIFVGWSVT